MAKGIMLGGNIDFNDMYNLMDKPQYKDNPGALAKTYMESAYKGLFNVGTTKRDQQTIASNLRQLASRNGVLNNSNIQKIIYDLNTKDYDSNDMKYLASKVEGQFNDAIANRQMANAIDTAPNERSSSVGASGDFSGGGSDTPTQEPVSYYTEEDLAKKFGIVSDYATILKEMQDATESKFNEIDATLNRAVSTNARSQETAYSQYLQDLRSRAANAVASGATKGTMAANALGSLMTAQETNREGINTLNTLISDSALQKGTALKTDATLARQTSNELGQYLGNLATSRDTNNINKYVGELSANAQRYAASVQAGATTNAARIASNAAADKILEIYKNTYKAKGLSDKDAFNAANIRYADYLDKTIAK